MKQARWKLSWGTPDHRIAEYKLLTAFRRSSVTREDSYSQVIRGGLFDINLIVANNIYIFISLILWKRKRKQRKYKESKNMKDVVITMRADEENNSASADFL